MTRAEFLAALRSSLAQMPQEELERQIAYYDELLHDMTEDGMSEQEAVEWLGDPAQVARELLDELPLSTLVKNRVRPQGGWTALSIVLIVLGLPLWLPLLLAALSVLLAVVITVWALAFSLGAVVFALGVTAVALAGSLLFGYFTASPLMLSGLALIALGVCILGALLLKPLCRGIAQFCAALIRMIKSLFIKRGTQT